MVGKKEVLKQYSIKVGLALFDWMALCLKYKLNSSLDYLIHHGYSPVGRLSFHPIFLQSLNLGRKLTLSKKSGIGNCKESSADVRAPTTTLPQGKISA